MSVSVGGAMRPRTGQRGLYDSDSMRYGVWDRIHLRDDVRRRDQRRRPVRRQHALCCTGLLRVRLYSVDRRRRLLP